MKRIALAAAAAVAAIACASAASASTYFTVGPVGSDGGFTVVFGDLGINTPTFNDIFSFSVPTGPSGKADFTVTSTMSTDSQNITFTNVNFNGTPFNVETSGWNETRSLNHVPVAAGSTYTLQLAGNAGVAGTTPNASYSGVITFAPNAAVPEPASWALMIAGFGGAGAVLRRRRAKVVGCAA